MIDSLQVGGQITKLFDPYRDCCCPAVVETISNANAHGKRYAALASSPSLMAYISKDQNIKRL